MKGFRTFRAWCRVTGWTLLALILACIDWLADKVYQWAYRKSEQAETDWIDINRP